MTADLPLKLPKSTKTPSRGAHAAIMPRKRASFSRRKPGTSLAACQASLRAASSPGGTRTGITCRSPVRGADACHSKSMYMVRDGVSLGLQCERLPEGQPFGGTVCAETQKVLETERRKVLRGSRKRFCAPKAWTACCQV